MPLILWSAAFLWSIHANRVSNERCAQLLAPRDALLERVVRALDRRDDLRFWNTFVSEVGAPGNRQFLVHVGPKDRDLHRIPAAQLSALATFAFRVNHLERDRNTANVRVIRRDEYGAVVRIEWEQQVRFPNPTSESVDRLALASTDGRRDDEARSAIRGQLYQPGGPTLAGPMRVRMDVRLVIGDGGAEKAEAVVVEAQMKGPNGWVTIGSGTDR